MSSPVGAADRRQSLNFQAGPQLEGHDVDLGTVPGNRDSAIRAQMVGFGAMDSAIRAELVVSRTGASPA
jgi:hypothetical protein